MIEGKKESREEERGKGKQNGKTSDQIADFSQESEGIKKYKLHSKSWCLKYQFFSLTLQLQAGKLVAIPSRSGFQGRCKNSYLLWSEMTCDFNQFYWQKPINKWEWKCIFRQQVKKHIKRCLTYFLIREMQNKAIVKATTY